MKNSSESLAFPAIQREKRNKVPSHELGYQRRDNWEELDIALQNFAEDAGREGGGEEGRLA